MNNKTKQLAPITCIILTWNEEKHIERSIRSVADLCDQVLVFDSMSTDRTEEIARRKGAEFVTREFDNFASQRNAALAHPAVRNEWILMLDADEYLTEELKEEIRRELPQTICQGFFLKRRFYFYGKWIKRGGYYPTWLLRLFRRSGAKCSRKVNEHIFVEGQVGYLKHDFVDENLKGISEWVRKHNSYSDFEAEILVDGSRMGRCRTFFSVLRSPTERRFWLRQNVYNRLPWFLKPLTFFMYRYILRLGFLDGWQGLVYHLFQGFWYRLLIEVKAREIKRDQTKVSS